MNTDRIWFRKSPSRRSHHQCGSHAQQQRWKHRGWYWSPRIGSRVHSGCSTDLGTISKDLLSPRSWESCLHPPCSSGQPDDDWSNEGMRCLATIPGCREVAAEGTLHCLLLCTHTWKEVLTISYFSQQVPWSSPLGVANWVIAVDHSLPLLVQTSKNVRDVVGEEPKLFGIDFCVSSIESHFVT